MSPDTLSRDHVGRNRIFVKYYHFHTMGTKYASNYGAMSYERMSNIRLSFRRSWNVYLDYRIFDLARSFGYLVITIVFNKSIISSNRWRMPSVICLHLTLYVWETVIIFYLLSPVNWCTIWLSMFCRCSSILFPFEHFLFTFHGTYLHYFILIYSLSSNIYSTIEQIYSTKHTSANRLW